MADPTPSASGKSHRSRMAQGAGREASGREVRRRCCIALLALLLQSGAPHPAFADAAPGPESKVSAARADKGTWIVLLGTAGGPLINPGRAQPSNLLVVDGRPYLIDCGDGALGRLAQSGFQPHDVDRVFLTHLHLDHVADVAPLIAFDWVSPQRQRIEVFGPAGTKSFVASALTYMSIPEELYSEFMPPHPDMREMVTIHEIEAREPRLIYRDDKVRVSAVENTHYVTTEAVPRAYGHDRSYAYRFDTAERSVVFSGDTGPSDRLAALAQGADVLVSEILDLDSTVELIRRQSTGTEDQLTHMIDHMRREHLTPEELGKLAQKAGVKKVVLNHLAPQVTDGAELVMRVRRHYTGPVVLGNDLDRF